MVERTHSSSVERQAIHRSSRTGMLTLKDLWYLLDFGLERVELAQASEKGVDFFFFFLYTIICSCLPRTSRELLLDNQVRFSTGKKTDDGWRGLIWILFAINLN